jgi:hypothetical protein
MLLMFRGRGLVEAPQDDRRAENEALFREINERVSQMRGQTGQLDLATDELLDFLCECARQECLEKLQLSPMEYERVRSVPTDFLVVPGHQVADIERVVSENERFTVVRKEGRAAEIARKRDPRSLPSAGWPPSR